MFAHAITVCFVFTDVLTVVEEDQACITTVLTGDHFNI